MQLCFSSEPFRASELVPEAARVHPSRPSIRASELVLEAPVFSLEARVEYLEAACASQQAQLQSFGQLQHRLEDLAAAISQQSNLAEGIQAKQKELQTEVDELGADQAEAVVADEGEPQPQNPLSQSIIKMLHHHLAFDVEYNWSESLWDAAVFIGTEQMCIAESLVLIFCLVVYIVLVAVFLIVSFTVLSLPSFDEQTEHEFNFWRTTVAHHPSFRNMITGESLARSVCDQKLYTPFSNIQSSTFGDLDEYLGTLSFYGGFRITEGMLMCTLSLLIWYLTLSVEIRQIADSMSALTDIPLARHTRFEQDPSSTFAVRLVSVSRCRHVFIVCIGVARFAVVATLAISGSLFLGYEASLEDMLLNAAALEMILNLDEMFFSALLPKITQGIFGRIQPVGYRRTHIHWNSYGSCMCIVLVILCAYLFTFSYILVPFRGQLQASHDALCGGVEGSLDFVQVTDSIGIPWAAKTYRSSGISETYAQYAVKSAQQNGFLEEELTSGQRKNTGSFMQVPTADELDRLMESLPVFKSSVEWELVDFKDIAYTVGWKEEFFVLTGSDFGDALGTVYNNYLQFLLQKEGVTCKDVPEDLCTKYGIQSQDIVMRKLCASWCGCASPLEGTVSHDQGVHPNSGFKGCSIKDTRTRQFANALATLPCRNAVSFEQFSNWVQGVGNARSLTGGMLKDELIAAFTSGGCDAVAAHEARFRLCEESSLQALCPESCGCNDSIPWDDSHSMHTDFCPYSCGKDTPVCRTIKVDYHNFSHDRGPFVGFPCVFPWYYQGVAYFNCSSVDWMGPWCAVAQRDSHHHIAWGDCPETC